MAEEKEKTYMAQRSIFGRRTIKTDYREITPKNVVEVLNRTLQTHNMNVSEIDYLYKYYKGYQPILGKIKEVRPEINNKIVVNLAKMIADFHVGYLVNEPIEYISKNGEKTDAINMLNNYMDAENKESSDKNVIQWMEICGLGYRIILPDEKGIGFDESPFEIYDLDPRYTYLVRYSGLGNEVVMGVTYCIAESGERTYYVYTKDSMYVITDDKVITQEPHILGRVPIIEYQLNSAKLGVFEPVLSLLDAINCTYSDRLDGLDQFIQALLVFHNVDVDEEQYDKMRARGAVAFKDASPDMKGTIEYLISQLDQTSTQTLVDSMYDVVLEIVGMPQRTGGASTSDTGSAVILRDGWYQAESNAKDTELEFKRSEKVLLKIAIAISSELSSVDLLTSDVDIKFNRRMYDNLLSKVQAFTTLMTASDSQGNPIIAPQLVFELISLFADSDRAWKVTEEYVESIKKEKEEKAKQIALGNAQQMGYPTPNSYPKGDNANANTGKANTTDDQED